VFNQVPNNCLIKHHTMMINLGSGDTAPHILSLGMDNILKCSWIFIQNNVTNFTAHECIIFSTNLNMHLTFTRVMRHVPVWMSCEKKKKLVILIILLGIHSHSLKVTGYQIWGILFRKAFFNHAGRFVFAIQITIKNKWKSYSLLVSSLISKFAWTRWSAYKCVTAWVGVLN
jgi:hypothetical protein